MKGAWVWSLVGELRSHMAKKNVATRPAALDSLGSLIEMQNLRPCPGHTGEGDNRGWDGWMASPTWGTWVWASSGCWWWTGRPGVLQSMGSQRVRQDWATELNWTERVLIHMHREVLQSTFPLVVRTKKFACGCGALTTSPVWFLLCSWAYPSLHKAVFKCWVRWDTSSATHFDLHGP